MIDYEYHHQSIMKRLHISTRPISSIQNLEYIELHIRVPLEKLLFFARLYEYIAIQNIGNRFKIRGFKFDNTDPKLHQCLNAFLEKDNTKNVMPKPIFLLGCFVINSSFSCVPKCVVFKALNKNDDRFVKNKIDAYRNSNFIPNSIEEI